MNGATISIAAADDSTFKGYLSIPASGSGPGLILLHEIFGLNQHIRDRADTYAEEGYVVLAPDLFWRIKPGVELGYSEEDFKTALTYRDRFDVEQAILDSRDALWALRANRACTGKVGAIGFCLGGLLAYLAAARLPVDAAAAYYGVGIDRHLGEAKSIQCPIALHFGSEDESVAAARARQSSRRTLETTKRKSTSIAAPATRSTTARVRPLIRAPRRWRIRGPSVFSAARLVRATTLMLYGRSTWRVSS